MLRSRISLYLLMAVVALFVSVHDGKAQRVAISTDVLQWALISPNLGFEVALSQHHALGFSASTCPVKVSDRLSVTHLSVSPQYKYWFRMPSYGHYAGADLMYSSYEIGGSAYAGSGNLLALRGTYGYSLILGRRWNLIPNAGLGLGLDWGDKISILPVIKLGVNIQMVIK